MRPYAELDKVFKINTLYTAFKNKFSPDYFFSGESHNFYEIVTVTDGVIGVTAGSDVYLIHAGEAIIHEPMEFHSLWSEEGTSPEVVIFTFSCNDLPNYTSKVFTVEDVSLPKRILTLLKDSYDIPKDSFYGIKNPDSADYQIALKELEIYLLKTLSKKLGIEHRISSKAAKNYALTVKILENNIDRRLSVSEIASMSRMSEINLKKTFSKYAGIGVMEYFNALKINAAKRMLLSGLSVKECALTLGFQNQNYFSAVFKRIVGICPSQFRQE